MFVLAIASIVFPPVAVLFLLVGAALIPYRNKEVKLPKLSKLWVHKAFRAILIIALLPILWWIIIPVFIYKYWKKKRGTQGSIKQNNTQDQQKIGSLKDEIAYKKRELEQLMQRNRVLEEQQAEQRRIESERPRLKHYNDLVKKKLDTEESNLESLKIKRLQEEIRQLKQNQ